MNTISQILQKFDENQLFVPAFQREYVWKRDNARQLLDSLIKGYPTGTMLIWETNSPPELKGSHIYDKRQGAVKILLDGQQRLTTLYMLVNGALPPYYSAAEIKNDPRGLYVNIETLELSYYSAVRMRSDARWINLTEIFQKKIRARQIIKNIEQKEQKLLGDSREDLIDDNHVKVLGILDREFPEQTIPIRASVQEAIDVFYKVNSGGVSLTDAELALAQISGYWPQAREHFKSKLSLLSRDGFSFKLDFIVYALLGILHYSGSDMRKLHGAENNEAIRVEWQKLESHTFDFVVNLLRTHAFVDNTTEINSVYALIPIIVFCQQENNILDHATVKRIVKWFYYSQVRRRYISQLPQKLDHDLRVVRDSELPFDRLLDVIREDRGGNISLSPEEFDGRAVQHPLFGLMKWYLKSKGAICLTTGVSIRQPVGTKYRLENDHIFPYSRLKAKGYGKDNRIKYALAQEFTNRALLTQKANRTKSNMEAAAYLATVDKNFPSALSLQLIPTDPELWKIDNYEHFLSVRRALLCEELNAFLESISDSVHVTEEVTLEELISEGESDELEFKSSLRWDIRQQIQNSALEGAVLKTIAAFSNCHGGTLLIGVEDNGEIVGLENDYKTLNGANKDKYQLHLMQLIGRSFGKAFSSSKVSVDFAELGDSEICRVEVRPANAPIFFEKTSKHGMKEEVFFVRNGNSSQPLRASEVPSYCKERFT